MRITPLRRAAAIAITLAASTACIPDPGSPMPTSSTSPSTTIPIPLTPISGGEAPLGTGATLPGGGALVFFHSQAPGGPALNGRWPFWQYTGSSVQIISASTITGAVPGAPASPDQFGTYAPNWSRVAVTSSPFGTEIRTLDLRAPSTPGALLGTLNHGFEPRERRWSPNGRYLAVSSALEPGEVVQFEIWDTNDFSNPVAGTFSGIAPSPALANPWGAGLAWDDTSSNLIVGTPWGYGSTGLVGGAPSIGSGFWPLGKACGVSDVSGTRLSFFCLNPSGSDYLVNTFTEELGGADRRLVISPLIIRPLGAAGLAPDALFSPDGAYLAVNLNTLPGMTTTRGVLAVVAEEPGATPIQLTGLTATTPPGGDAPFGWVAAPLPS